MVERHAGWLVVNDRPLGRIATAQGRQWPEVDIESKIIFVDLFGSEDLAIAETDKAMSGSKGALSHCREVFLPGDFFVGRAFSSEHEARLGHFSPT